MVRLNVENLAKTQVESDNGTSIDVVDTSVFPPTPFKIVITEKELNLTLGDIEIIEVGNVDTTNDTLENLSRAQEGTTQTTWSNGAYVDNRSTAGFWDEVATEIEGKLDSTDYNPEADTHDKTTSSDIDHANVTNVLADQHHQSHEHPGDQQATSSIEDNQGNTIWDYVNQYIPDSVIQKVWGANRDAGGNSLTNQSTTWSDFNNLDLSNVSNAAQADFATFGQATVNLADGDSLQLARTHIPTGQTIKVIKAAISQKDGTYGTSGLDIEVYDQTDSTSIYSFDSSASTTEGLDEGSYDSPLATGGTGNEIIIRISNSTGSAQDVQAWLTAVIE